MSSQMALALNTVAWAVLILGAMVILYILIGSIPGGTDDD